jgi:transposase
MNATATLPIVGVDLAKSVLQLAIADRNWLVIERQRLTRTQFQRWFTNRAVGLVVMEACGSCASLGTLVERPWDCGATVAGAVRARLRQAQQD